MNEKVRWGILGCANIAIQKVIPAMQKGQFCEIAAISSRNYDKSKKTADLLNIPKAYGSYEELLSDKDIDAIYIPLPNHMHVEWSVKCMEAGKHVLCEKPLALKSEEIKKLISVRDKTGKKISEAFMVRSHPQWIKAKELAKDGTIGELKTIQGFFSYYNSDANNIRNIKDYGGGGVWDIGCYPINTSRFIFDEEPKRVISLMENDKEFHTDVLASAILDFPSGQAIFTSSTQLSPYQTMNILGTKNRIEVEIPFNAPIDKKSVINVGEEVIEFDICDQYTLQGDNFSKSILDNTEVPVTLEDSFCNTLVIEALFRSSKSNNWEDVK